MDAWYRLFRKREFLPLFITQFFGAFNDNAFKLAMLTLVSYYLSHSQTQSEHYQAIAGGLFILPFFLFSATAGQLADRYDKAILTRLIKLLELLLMILGGFALYYANTFLLMATLTGMGIHSTFFGPIKYAILPDQLPHCELLNATALIEASTFLAILLGTTLGALSINNQTGHAIYAIALTNVAALIGLITSFFIPPAPGATSSLRINWRIIQATRQMLGQVIHNKNVLPTIIIISWFWLIGAVMLTKLPDYTHYVLRANTHVFALFLALFSIGIAAGSLAISKFLRGRISLRYVPFTMVLLSICAADLSWATPDDIVPDHLQSLLEFLLNMRNWRIIIDFSLFSFCSGLFIVPLYTYLQVSCQEQERARTIAANNIFNALAMVIGSILIIILLHFKVAISSIFMILAVSNVIMAAAFWYVLLIFKRNLTVTSFS